MKTLKRLCLLSALALFLVHEMDAMTHSEWLLLPVLSEFTEATGRDLFLLLHIPLYLGILWALFLASWQNRAQQVFYGVLVVHAIAHFALSGHELYSFVAPIETITVYGAALAGAGFIALSLGTISE